MHLRVVFSYIIQQLGTVVSGMPHTLNINLKEQFLSKLQSQRLIRIETESLAERNLSCIQLVSVVLSFKFPYFSLLSQDSSVSEMTEYGQDDQSSVSDMDKNISLCHHIQTVCKIHPTSRPVDVRNSHWQSTEAEHASPSDSEVCSALCLYGEEASCRIFLDCTK
jgi:hypothetical protein